MCNAVLKNKNEDIRTTFTSASLSSDVFIGGIGWECHAPPNERNYKNVSHAAGDLALH